MLRQLFLPQPVTVEHIGSTAVPGMAARPVVDILVGVSPLLPLAQYEQLFLHTDYQPRPACKAGRHLFYRPALQITGYSVQLLPLAGFYGQDELLLRDFLRARPHAAAQACAAKQAAFGRYRSDPRMYAQAKATLQNQLLQAAATARSAPQYSGNPGAVVQKASTVLFPPRPGAGSTPHQ